MMTGGSMKKSEAMAAAVAKCQALPAEERSRMRPVVKNCSDWQGNMPHSDYQPDLEPVANGSSGAR